MFCTRCGNELPEGNSFCTKCGAKVEPQEKDKTKDRSGESVVGQNDPSNKSEKGSTDERAVAVSADATEKARETAGLDAASKTEETSSKLAQENQTKSKSSKRKKVGLIVGGGAIAAVIIAIVVVYNVFFSPIDINENAFPDPVVRESIIATVDPDGDGKITRDEAQEVESLDIKGATSVSGLGVFPNLQHLKVEGENLTSVDVEGCNSLKEFTATKASHLTEVKLGSQPDLEVLDVSGTAVKELDLKGDSKLTTLKCDNQVNLVNLDDTPLHEYWVVESFKSDPSITPSAFCNTMQASYDNKGNLAKLTVDNAEYGLDTYTYEYDDQGRCIATDHSNKGKGSSSTTNYRWNISYNDKGLMTKADQQQNVGGYTYETSETISYNAQNLPTSHDYIVAQGGASSDRFTYDANGELTLIEENSVGAETFSITNNSNGLMTNIVVSGSAYASNNYSITYDDAGRIVAFRDDTSSQTLEYDSNGRLVNTVRQTSNADNASAKYVNASVSSTKYEYNDKGLLTKVTPTRSGSGMVEGYSISYKRLLIDRDTAPDFNIIDLSDPLSPNIHPLFWSMNEYLYSYNFPWMKSMKNIMSLTTPATQSAQSSENE